jgi:pimeloyl-ACP methyl ester carboxylesterase
MTTDTTPVRRRRGFLFWLGRIALGLVAFIVLLMAAGIVYQSIASARDRAAFPAPGRMVDIGGFRLHLYCTGHGAPTVILESGLTGIVPIWHHIQSAVSRTTRVCSYDRAGIGWSETSPNPRDALHIANELHAVLAKSGTAGPYVLAGHSSGGLYARAYQRLYPAEVVGLVLIDSTPEGYHATTPEGRKEWQSTTNAFRFTPLLARLGLIRLSPLCRAPNLDAFPAREAAEFRAFCAASGPWSVYGGEHHFVRDPLPRGFAAQPMTIPLAIITAGENIKELTHWGPLQAKLATLSTDGVHVIVPGASHVSLLLNRHDASVSGTQILRVVEAVRKRQLLRGLEHTAP